MISTFFIFVNLIVIVFTYALPLFILKIVTIAFFFAFDYFCFDYIVVFCVNNAIVFFAISYSLILTVRVIIFVLDDTVYDHLNISVVTTFLCSKCFVFTCITIVSSDPSLKIVHVSMTITAAAAAATVVCFEIDD